MMKGPDIQVGHKAQRCLQGGMGVGSELPDSGLRVGGEQKPTGSEACKTLPHVPLQGCACTVRWKPPLRSTRTKDTHTLSMANKRQKAINGVIPRV